MTEKHHLLTNDEFEEKFTNCDLPAVIFTHEAHLRLAYIYINKYGLDKAISKLSIQIADCDNKYGDGTKYNKTLTIASTNIMYHFVKKAKSSDFKNLLVEYPKLKNDFIGLLKSHYDLDILNSKKAVKEYLEPDLAPFN